MFLVKLLPEWLFKFFSKANAFCLSVNDKKPRCSGRLKLFAKKSSISNSYYLHQLHIIISMNETI